jgi:phosphoribosyl-AMP cyclohydrolase
MCYFASLMPFMPEKSMVEPDFEKGKGLLPAIVQDYSSGKVLMLAYINRESWRMTLETGEAFYFSRSRQELWHKGGTSGHIQIVKDIFIDCDKDAVLFKVQQIGGAACHTGYESCFHNKIDRNGETTVVGEKVFDPVKVYHR